MKKKGPREFSPGKSRWREWLVYLRFLKFSPTEMTCPERLSQAPAGSSTGETGGQNDGRRGAGERPFARLAKYLI